MLTRVAGYRFGICIYTRTPQIEFSRHKKLRVFYIFEFATVAVSYIYIYIYAKSTDRIFLENHVCSVSILSVKFACIYIYETAINLIQKIKKTSLFKIHKQKHPTGTDGSLPEYSICEILLWLPNGIHHSKIQEPMPHTRHGIYLYLQSDIVSVCTIYAMNCTQVFLRFHTNKHHQIVL